MKDAGPFKIRVWKFDHWAYMGATYATRECAKSWIPFVRKSWYGMKACVVSKQQVEREKERQVDHVDG